MIRIRDAKLKYFASTFLNFSEFPIPANNPPALISPENAFFC
jgi:hypothetical protein